MNLCVERIAKLVYLRGKQQKYTVLLFIIQRRSLGQVKQLRLSTNINEMEIISFVISPLGELEEV